MRLIFRGIAYSLVNGVPMLIALIIVRAFGAPTLVQVVVVCLLALLNLFATWQGQKTTRNADIAAALARGQGTYIVGGVPIPKQGTKTPTEERLGIQLAGVQPGATPRNLETGAPLHLDDGPSLCGSYAATPPGSSDDFTWPCDQPRGHLGPHLSSHHASLEQPWPPPIVQNVPGAAGVEY